jgi:hypothetical protein
LFRETRARVSTENIGLARLREGLDLVRIGRPQGPEFAAWRYGDQLGRRRIRTWSQLGAFAVGSTAVTVGAIGAAAAFATPVGVVWTLGGFALAQPRAAHAVLAVATSARRTRSASSTKLQPAVRLALEMSLHEEQERRALEGELKLLEAAWREAEEIASISDGLLTPNVSVRSQRRRLIRNTIEISPSSLIRFRYTSESLPFTTAMGESLRSRASTCPVLGSNASSTASYIVFMST